jgi:hypothetical protein
MHGGLDGKTCKTIAARDSRFNGKTVFRIKSSSPRKPYLWDDSEGGQPRPVKVYNAKEIRAYMATH